MDVILRGVIKTMAAAFYWRRRKLVGAALTLFGLASIIEIVPLFVGQYYLLIEKALILVAPAVAAILVSFLLLLEMTESFARYLFSPLTRLLRPIIYSAILVTILRYATFFIGLSILLPLTLNWRVLDSPTWSYVLAQTAGAMATVLLSSYVTKRILKRQ
ncbi:MAG: hypothetical protein ACTSW4_03010 [Candidatus Ranarchaeia archaeon]